MVTPDWVKQKTFYTTGIVPAGVASIVDPTRVLVVAGRGGAAGDGLVSPVLAHERPFICFPEPRDFDEQAAKAGRLAALGAAIVPASWPEAEQWQLLIAAAELQPSQRPSVLQERHDVASRFNSSPRWDRWHGRSTRSASCVSQRNANATERGAFGLQTAVRSNLV